MIKSKRGTESRQTKGEANPLSSFFILLWCCELLSFFSGGLFHSISRLVCQNLLIRWCKRSPECLYVLHPSLTIAVSCQSAAWIPAAIKEADNRQNIPFKELESLILHGMQNLCRSLPKEVWRVGEERRARSNRLPGMHSLLLRPLPDTNH